MVSKKRVTRSISISLEADQIIQENFKYGQVGRWFEEQLFDTFASNRINIEKELEETKYKMTALQNQLKEMDKITQEEIEFFRSANKRLQRNPTFMKGILNQYFNVFGKRVTEKYFRQRMKRLIKDG